MKLKWYGHACFSMTFQNGTTFVTDPFDETVGYPLCRAEADVALLSHDHFDHNHVQSLSGEPVVKRDSSSEAFGGVKVYGVDTFHDDANGQKRGKNVVFVLEGDGMRAAHLGDLGHMLSPEQEKELKNLDLLLVPIGGTYTVDSAQAAELVSRLRPKIAVAMHFKTPPNGFDITDEKVFARMTSARCLGSGEMEILPETAEGMSGVWVMDYPGKQA